MKRTSSTVEQNKRAALTLRTARHTYQAIADHLGISKARAHQLVHEAIEEHPTDTNEELYAITLVGLDLCIARAYDGFTQPVPLREKHGAAVLDDEGNVIWVPPDARRQIAYLVMYVRFIIDRAKFVGVGMTEQNKVEHVGATTADITFPMESEEDFVKRMSAAAKAGNRCEVPPVAY